MEGPSTRWHPSLTLISTQFPLPVQERPALGRGPTRASANLLGIVFLGWGGVGREAAEVYVGDKGEGGMARLLVR